MAAKEEGKKFPSPLTVSVMLPMALHGALRHIGHWQNFCEQAGVDPTSAHGLSVLARMIIDVQFLAITNTAQAAKAGVDLSPLLDIGIKDIDEEVKRTGGVHIGEIKSQQEGRN